VSATPAAGDIRGNAVLAGLPPRELERMVAVGQAVAVATGDEVYSREHPVEHVYFPLTAVFSYVAVVDDEIVVEVGTIGREGMVGVPGYLGVTHSPHRTFCQVPGDAVRVTLEELRGLLVDDGALHDMLNRYVQALMVQMAQNVACNRIHSTEERAARWLLTTQDRVTADTFPLTQQFLAQMLGVRRPTVSLTAGTLQSAGLIRYTRGIVTVTDREGLIESSCDCYRLIRDETDRLMHPASRG
jgi:CRP-like cAMP-binding protein